MTSNTHKQSMRMEAKARLASAKVDAKIPWASVAEWFEQHPEHQCIAIFSAIQQEPNLLPWIEASGIKRSWVLPRVSGDQLHFFQIKQVHEDLEFGTYGILEPKAHLIEINPDKIDCIFCPGLAFTQEGHRLGRGGGFYDRALNQLPSKVFKIGVAYDCQCVNSLPQEAHDVMMDEMWWFPTKP